jgi:hypothetical protein
VGVLGALGGAGDFLVAFIFLVTLVVWGCSLPWACGCFKFFDGDDDDDPAGGGKGDSGDVGAGAVILCTPTV